MKYESWFYENRVRLVVALAIGLSLSFFPKTGVSQTAQNEDCLACHENINLEKYKSSVHGSNLCTSCHNDIQELPHADKLKKVSCADCHKIEAEIYYSSDHGKAVKSGIQAASCLDCHGEVHALLSARNPKSPVYRSNIPQTCSVCHENQKKMAPYSLLEKMPLRSYAATVHGKALLEKGEISSATCTDCHGSHDLHAPTNPKSKIFRSNVPSTCGKCHENVLQTYERSIHGKAALAGKREAPVCTDCHGEHTIRSHLDPASSVYTTTVSVKTCGQCHAAEKIITKYGLPSDRVKTYLESYHGLASEYGVTTVANCASCHGAHNILPASDPLSSVNKKNLPKTCGKCHPNAGEQLAKGSIHLAPSPTGDRAVYCVTVFYIVLISVLIGGMTLHNLLDFSAKLREHYQRAKEKGIHIRFTTSERIQHFLLTVIFVILAYSGFALKYAQTWWARPFAILGGEVDLRGITHRVAAVIFVVLSIYHVFFVLITRRGKQQLKALVPERKDVADFYGTIKYNLGLQSRKPLVARYNYVEKAEYWALVWGSLIMITTGTILTFENIAMKYWPKWTLDVATAIHFYEAILASLAIVVWHFYFTIFDPDHYPMNWNMMTGKVSDEEKREDDSQS